MKIAHLAVVLVLSALFPACQGLVSGEKNEQMSDVTNETMAVPEHGIHYLEVVTPDPKALRDFYSDACGWQFSEATPELGNAYFALMPGGSLWGIRGPLRESETPVVRTYLRVIDIRSAIKKAGELGAKIALEPTELPGRGIIAIYIIGGIEQGIWQVP